MVRNTKWFKGIADKDGKITNDHKDLGDNYKDGSRAIIGFTFTTAKDAS